MLNNEEWKQITGFENYYEVSNFGRVRNSRKQILKFYTINSGYKAIKLTVNNKRYSFLVHRLVAEQFKEKPNKFCTEVNHIDENKENNFADNLEWVTSKQNKQHSILSGTYDKLKEMKNSLGKKHLPNPLSKYHNVTYDKNRKKWQACIRINGQNKMFKRFNTEIEAALHVNHIIDTLGLTDRPKNII